MKEWITKNGYKIIRIVSGRSSVFLLTNGVDRILIDTSSPDSWEKINIRLISLNIKTIDYLILTHTHYDHAGNACKIKENFKAKVIVHKDEKEIIQNGLNVVPKGTVLFTKIMVKLTKNIAKKMTFQACRPDILVDSSLNLKNFGFNAYILHTPGHSKGSISVVIDNEITIVGDAMFGISRKSIFPPFADNISDMLKSWKKLLDTGSNIFLPAHGNENSRIKVEKNYNKIIF